VGIGAGGTSCSLPISIPFILAWATVGVVLLLCVMVYYSIRTSPDNLTMREELATRKKEENALCQTILAAGRFLPWATLAPKLLAAEGTLIIEQWSDDPKRPRCRFWWTGEDVTRLAPVAPPSPNHLDVYGSKRPHPFVVWCFNQYLHPEHGKAVLTEPKEAFGNAGMLVKGNVIWQGGCFPACRLLGLPATVTSVQAAGMTFVKHRIGAQSAAGLPKQDRHGYEATESDHLQRHDLAVTDPVRDVCGDLVRSRTRGDSFYYTTSPYKPVQHRFGYGSLTAGYPCASILSTARSPLLENPQQPHGSG